MAQLIVQRCKHLAARRCATLHHRLPCHGHATSALSPSGFASKLKRSQPSAVCRVGQSGEVIDIIAMTLLTVWSSLFGKWRLRSCTKYHQSDNTSRTVKCEQEFHFSHFSYQILINFPIFSSNFPNCFLPHFGRPPGKALRLRHWRQASLKAALVYIQRIRKVHI